MHSITINAEAWALLRSEIVRCITELLESKHLYQVVRVNTSPILLMIEEADKSPEVINANRLASSVLPGSGRQLSRGSSKDDILRDYRRKIEETVNEILFNTFWTFSTDACDHLIQAKGAKTSESMTHFSLPTISVVCAQCDANLPAHNSGYRGQTQDIQPISWKVQKNDKQIPCQTFVFPFHCQACKKEPLVFLVHREGDKLLLAGRNHFETVQIPKPIPKEEAAWFKDAIAAYNTGNILAGLFLLRTTVEQYMRRLLKTTGKKRGDELADAYARLLDDEFPKRHPSLKVIYDELSSSIHAADNSAPQFEKSRRDIEMHFEQLRLLPLKETGAN